MKISLKIKAVVVVLCFTIALSVGIVTISYNTYTQAFTNHYESLATSIAKATASVVDKNQVSEVASEVQKMYADICVEYKGIPNYESFSDADWEMYYNKFAYITEMPEYQALLNVLGKLREDHDVVSLYLGYTDLSVMKDLYLVDASVEGQCLPGDCDDIQEEHIEQIKNGDYEFPAFITNYEEYGWLCSASAPIINDDGKVIGVALVDISMNEIMEDREEFLLTLVGITTVMAVVIMVLIMFLVNKAMLYPINELSMAAGSFVSDKENHGVSGGESAITKLQIHTGDEIEKLAESIKKMEDEINAYIENLTLVTAEKERIGAELNVATQIQADMLPNIFPAFPEHDEFDIYATMVPAKEVGGDFYDMFMVDESHLAIVMADVSGKGVPAALFMVIAKTLIKNHALNKEAPSQIFTNVNNQLCENNEVGMFVTGWMGIMDIFTGHMDYVNAGHNYPIVVRKDGSVEWIKSRPGFVLAGMEGVRYRQNELQLEEGDKIYLYTDGVTEALDVSQELFGDERLEKVLSAEDVKDMKPEMLLRKVAEELKQFAGEAEQADDITMLALYRTVKEKTMKTSEQILQVSAKIEEWNVVSEFLEKQLEEFECPFGIQAQILIAAEEIFVNIASYAYGDKEGEAEIKTSIDLGGCFEIEFRDSGIPYNPLEKEDPDTTLSAEERNIGGLGIFMVKKSMDDVKYEYKEGKNCLVLQKNLLAN